MGKPLEIVLPQDAPGAEIVIERIINMLSTLAALTTTGKGEWPEKYGANWENDTYMMHRFCWCDKDDCPWCISCTCPDEPKEPCEACQGRLAKAPNFLHKPSGFNLRWYKYIGRGMEYRIRDGRTEYQSPSSLITLYNVMEIEADCLRSIGYSFTEPLSFR
jgi:hypothetical protein